MHRIKNVSWQDIRAIPVFILSIFPAMLFKIFLVVNKKQLWLLSEENEASDNAYVFFKFLKKEHPEILSFYAINKKSKDFRRYQKECSDSPAIPYASFKHWIYYLAASVNISSQKGGKPNAAICYVLEVYGILKNKRVFLQHGIALNNLEFLHYKNTKMRLFITGARPEHEYIKKYFGYPEDYLAYCGLCRFDNLHNIEYTKNKIILMPTWRSWLKLKGKSEQYDNREIEDIPNSEYVKMYSRLITNQYLLEFLEKQNLELYFYPHRNAQPFLKYFEKTSDRIILCSEAEYSIDKLLKEGALLITDYSSVSIDFAYMKKPIIYFQFDEEKFRRMQYEKSYFDYKTSNFGRFAQTIDEVVKSVVYFCEKNFKIDEETERAHGSFFELYDTSNCERNFEAICKILE